MTVKDPGDQASSDYSYIPRIMSRKSSHILLMTMLLNTWQTTEANSFSCPVSRKTVQPVDSCPVTEEGWRERAAIKNCPAYAVQCDQPERLEYHCLINPFINETLEVCAYTIYIANGRCAEYNSLGNAIQANFDTNCTAFDSNPCPLVYRSNESFNYSGCYEMVKQTTKVTSDSAHMTSSSAATGSVITGVSDTGSPNVDRTGNDDTMEGTTPGFIVGLVIGIVLLGIIIGVVLWKLRKKYKMKNRRNDEEGNFEKIMENPIAMNELEPETNQGHRVISPSGQVIGSGYEKTGARKTDEEEIPLIPLKEETEEQECNRLLMSMNEALERIVLSRDTQKLEKNQEEFLDEIYRNPSLHESNMRLKEKMEKVKLLEKYFKRDRTSEINVEHED